MRSVGGRCGGKFGVKEGGRVCSWRIVEYVSYDIGVRKM